MAKEKKKNGEKEKKSKASSEGKLNNIHSDAKRSIAAIFLFALSILFVLSFFGSAGMLGGYVDNIVAAVFGWGKWISPLVLIIAGIILLYRKETLFYVTKIIGISVAFLSMLGFFHLYFEPKEMLKMVSDGSGGGYIGYGIASVLETLTGVIAGSVILGALFLIGMIVAFNFSIVGIIKKLFTSKEEGEGAEKIEFVQGPDQQKKDEKSSKPEEIVEESESKFGLLKKKISSLQKKDKEEFVPMAGMVTSGNWKLPPINILEVASGKAQGGDVQGNADIIQNTFRHFGIEVEPGEIKTGPTITQYSYRPAVGIKLTKITGLSNDLALALAAHPIRIEAPIPGKSLIGIEVPNKIIATVCLREILESDAFKNRKSNLTLLLGKDVNGEYIVADLQKMPHLMIAGSTGSGKSVSVNTILLSLLYQNSPEDLKLILVDPKRVELSLYNGIPHLLSDVIVENNKVINALRWAIVEMERRYKILQESGSKDLNSYIEKFTKGEKKKVKNHETQEVREENMERLPFVVIVIDELADLMMAHGKEVESAIIRLAQMARAVGIHLIVSTQRPSVEVLTGLIKANIATRLAFRVATQIDSRTILDAGGAEKLLGNGDMLYTSAHFSGLKRLQGVFVSEFELKKVVDFIKNQKVDRGEEPIGEDITSGIGEQSGMFPERMDFSVNNSSDSGKSDIYEQAKKVVIEAGKASTSLLQRRLGLGYAKAARIMDELEENGVVGPADGAKAREVFYSKGDTNYEDSMDDQIKRDKWQM